MTRVHGYQPTNTTTPGTPPNGPAGTSTAQPRHHRLAITTAATGYGSTVTLDGQDISHALTGLTLNLGVGRASIATLDLLLIDITEVKDAQTRILVPDATRDALTALGWTPPADPRDEDTSDVHITEFLVVHRYRTDQGDWAWSWRCWGDAGCDGHLALDLSNRPYAERKAREHLATEHPEAAKGA